MTSPDDRRKALEILDEGIANGARAHELALLLGVGLTDDSAALAPAFCRRLGRSGPSQGELPACGSPPQRRRTPTDPAHLQ